MLLSKEQKSQLDVNRLTSSVIPRIQVTGSPANVTSATGSAPDSIPYSLIMKATQPIPQMYYGKAPRLHLWIPIVLPQARWCSWKIVRSPAICFCHLSNFTLLSFSTHMSQHISEDDKTEKMHWVFTMCQDCARSSQSIIEHHLHNFMRGKQLWIPFYEEDRSQRKAKDLSQVTQLDLRM